MTHSGSSPAVTIYMPTHHTSAASAVRQDEIRLKNLAKQVTALTGSNDFNQQFLANIKTMLKEQSFWEKLTDGLVIFSSPGVFKVINLPIDCKEYVLVADKFYLAPLIGLLNDQRDYYVLVLAQHSPALLKGNMYGISNSGLKLPLTIKDELRLDEVGMEHEQQKSAYGGIKGYNGRGGYKNIADQERMHFWRIVDQMVIDQTDNNSSLILAGTESEVAEYKSLSQYPLILESFLGGSLNKTQPNQFLSKTTQIIMEEVIKPTHNKFLELYDRLQGQASNQVNDNINHIKIAADQGKVDKLMLPSIQYASDSIRESINHHPIINFPSARIAKTINDIVSQVWKTRGTIININQNQIPGKQSELLAIMRY